MSISTIRLLGVLLLYLITFRVSAEPLQVKITGVSGDILGNVVALLSIERERSEPLLNDVRMRRLFDRGKQEISQALQPFGYFNPVVRSQLRQQDHSWIAEYDINPGNPALLDSVDVQLLGPGHDDPELKALPAGSAMQNGAIASQINYESLKKNLLNTALDIGYLDAVYSAHQLRVDPRTNKAQLQLHLETGPRYLFGAVRFNDAGLDPRLLQKYVPFKPGTPYSGRALLELQRVLMDSDYFDSVTVIDDRAAAQHLEVPVNVRLTPRKRHKYTAGIGYGTDTGLRGKLGWEHRRINRMGHKLAVELSASQIHKGMTARYSLPLGDPRTDRLAFSVTDSEEFTNTLDSKIKNIGASYIRVRNKWHETWSVNYQDEDYRVGDQTGRTTLLMPGAVWSRVRADNALLPRNSTHIQVELRGAAQQILSDTSFLQIKTDIKRIIPVMDRDRLLVRAAIGASWVSRFTDLPATVRFFAGGDQSVRGYGYQTLGPTDSSGTVIGGRHLLVGSLEYEHALTETWRVAAFVDSGNAFDNLNLSMKTGAGIGIRRVLPVGMLRIDLGIAVSEPGHPLRLHISLGPDL